VFAAPLCNWLPLPLVLPCARVPWAPLAHRRICPVAPLTSSHLVWGCRPLPLQACPVGPSPRPSKLGPVHTCSNRSGRWPLPLVRRHTPRCQLSPLQQTGPRVFLHRPALAYCTSLLCKMITAWSQGGSRAFANSGSNSISMLPLCRPFPGHTMVLLLT
jgi:hypothetical protein